MKTERGNGHQSKNMLINVYKGPELLLGSDSICGHVEACELRLRWPSVNMDVILKLVWQLEASCSRFFPTHQGKNKSTVNGWQKRYSSHAESAKVFPRPHSCHLTSTSFLWVSSEDHLFITNTDPCLWPCFSQTFTCYKLKVCILSLLPLLSFKYLSISYYVWAIDIK